MPSDDSPDAPWVAYAAPGGNVARALIATDLDGTLLNSRSRLADTNRALLESLPGAGIIRVVATGRSLYSARRVIDSDFPIDYLVFASGAGIMDWRTQRLLLAHDLPGEAACAAVREVMARGLDFMLHEPVPDNHHFFAHRTGRRNPDFDDRIARYASFAKPLPANLVREVRTASQLVVVEPATETSSYDDLVAGLAHLKVIRTTSPLDGASRWIEIFPRTVSKALASEWVAVRHGLRADACLAIGNDFNDLDLLDWAGASFVVANAPSELLSRYSAVASNDAAGFREAVARWRERPRAR